MGSSFARVSINVCDGAVGSRFSLLMSDAVSVLRGLNLDSVF
eukprot:SAG31_NODE_1251_length_9110_cov_5.844412_1_plen_41_part_10